MTIAMKGGWICMVALILGSTVWAADPDKTESKLGKIRQQIDSVQKTLRNQTTQRDSMAARLRDVELTVSEARSKLGTVRKRQAESQRQRAQLQKERESVERVLRTERDALADQLRAAHLILGPGQGGSGQKEQLKLLFNQQNPVQVGRMFTYYGYFGRARAAHIETINAQLERLMVLDRELLAANEALAQLENEASTELESLKQARSKRALVVEDLEKQIKNRQTQLARLKKEESTLEKLLADLRRVTADFPITSEQPFGKAKGKLSWPVNGRIVANFGEKRQAGLTWNGVMLATERGSQVRSIYFGRVIYADYLPGLGLLTIIEHRGGYLSLYGHNDQLYKAVGDWVEPGDVIATAGDSGGRNRPELYFEIRKGAKPLNPRQWIKK